MNPLVVLVCLVAALSVMSAGARANPNSLPRDPSPETEKIMALPRALDEDERALISANNAFAFGLLRQLNASCTNANIFTSPFSASIALAMTMNGAAGKTLDEMRHVLGLAELSLARI